MKADNVALPAWIDKDGRCRRDSFYKGDEVWDPIANQYAKREVDPRTRPLHAVRVGTAALLKNNGGQLWDLGDGVCGLTLGSKANSVDADVIDLLWKSTERAEKDFRALVLFNEGEHFSVGANFRGGHGPGQKNWTRCAR